MSQDQSAGVAEHPVITLDEAQYDPQHHASNLNATADTREALESSTSNILNNISPSDQQELKAPNVPSQANNPASKNLNIETLEKSMNDTAAIGRDGGTVNAEKSSSVAPPIAIVRPLGSITSSTRPQPVEAAVTTRATIPSSTEQHCQPSITSISTNPDISHNNTTTNLTNNPNADMNVVKTKGNRRKMARVKAHPNALTVYEAELTSKDRATQKEAVRQYLDKRVKQDWKWVWPAEDSTPIDLMEALSTDLSPNDCLNAGTDSSAHKEEWRERDEWESDPSESENENPTSAKGPININSPDKESPFRFDSPDGVGELVKQRRASRRRRHKKKLAAEMEWNTGVHCYVERRDAWTCARHVPPPTGRGPHCIDTTQAYTNGSSHKAVDDFSDSEGWDAEVPIAKSLLPPDNAMRASITPQAYGMIYDKVILQSLTPSCPINLSDVIQSCVQGWKRDGEWPPSSSVPEPSLVAKKKQRRLSVLNILGLNQPTVSEAKGASPVAEKPPQTPNTMRKGFSKFWKRGDKVKGAPEGGAGA